MEKITLPENWQGESATFIEGALLAANCAVAPLAPDNWQTLIGVDECEMTSLILPYLHRQHLLLDREAGRRAGLPSFARRTVRDEETASGAGRGGEEVWNAYLRFCCF